MIDNVCLHVLGLLKRGLPPVEFLSLGCLFSFCVPNTVPLCDSVKIIVDRDQDCCHNQLLTSNSAKHDNYNRRRKNFGLSTKRGDRKGNASI